MLISHVCQLDQANLVFLLDVTSLAPCFNTLLLLAHGNDVWNGGHRDLPEYFLLVAAQCINKYVSDKCWIRTLYLPPWTWQRFVVVISGQAFQNIIPLSNISTNIYDHRIDYMLPHISLPVSEDPRIHVSAGQMTVAGSQSSPRTIHGDQTTRNPG